MESNQPRFERLQITLSTQRLCYAHAQTWAQTAVLCPCTNLSTNSCAMPMRKLEHKRLCYAHAPTWAQTAVLEAQTCPVITTYTGNTWCPRPFPHLLQQCVCQPAYSFACQCACPPYPRWGGPLNCPPPSRCPSETPVKQRVSSATCVYLCSPRKIHTSTSLSLYLVHRAVWACYFGMENQSSTSTTLSLFPKQWKVKELIMGLILSIPGQGHLKVTPPLPIPSFQATSQHSRPG